MDAVKLDLGLVVKETMHSQLCGINGASLANYIALWLLPPKTHMVLQHARVTHQRVVLGLWRSDLDAVKLDIGLVVGRVTSKLLRSVLVAIISARK